MIKHFIKVEKKNQYTIIMVNMALIITQIILNLSIGITILCIS